MDRQPSYLATSPFSHLPNSPSSPKIKSSRINAFVPIVQDKTKGKKRDGTPDKSLTPGADDESLADSRPAVLDNEEIRSLAIKNQEDELAKDYALLRQALEMYSIRAGVQAEREVKPRSHKPVKVKKVRECPPPVKTTTIKVARGAPPNALVAHVEEDQEQLGPAFDSTGSIIPHSILGSVEEYRLAAKLRGRTKTPDGERVQTPSPQTPTLYTGRPDKPRYSDKLDLKDPTSRALHNWQQKMDERKMQQYHVSGMVNRPLDELVMNQGDKYRRTQEVRYLIDRSIPAYDYGKGYRVGSEFWAQPPRIADEITGINMSLNRTQQGYPPSVEHIRIPMLTKPETCTYEFNKENKLNIRQHQKPWHRTNYLLKRVDELEPIMKDLVPHIPDAEVIHISGSAVKDLNTADPYNPIEPELCVGLEPIEEKPALPVDPNDPLSSHPDVYAAPVFGPALCFAGENVSWTGDGTTFAGQIAVDARVSFVALTKQRTTMQLEITNVGTAAVYYDWEKVPEVNHFDIPKPKVQRFYFNTSNGSILPGDTLKFPFVFKSDKAGIYTEQWKFITSPRLAGGATLLCTLRGVAIQEDKYKNKREQVERDIQRGILEKGIRAILDDVINNLQIRERPRSPIDSYITSEILFSRKHPHLYYKHEIIEKINELYDSFKSSQVAFDGTAALRQTPEPLRVKHIDITLFKAEVLETIEDDEQRASYLETINDALLQLSFPVVTPTLSKMYQICYQHLTNLVDGISGHSSHVRQLMGLPDKANEVQDEAASKGTDAKSKGPTPPKAAAKTPGKEEKKSGKADPKKEPKKESAGKQKDNGRGSPTKKPPSTPSKATAAAPSASNVMSEGEKEQDDKSVSLRNPVLQRKYLEKVHMQVYSDMRQFILGLTDAFIRIHEEEDQV